MESLNGGYINFVNIFIHFSIGGGVSLIGQKICNVSRLDGWTMRLNGLERLDYSMKLEHEGPSTFGPRVTELWK